MKRQNKRVLTKLGQSLAFVVLIGVVCWCFVSACCQWFGIL